MNEERDEQVRKLLEEYSHVPPGEVKQHIYETVSLRSPAQSFSFLICTFPTGTFQRERAWAVRAYPCTGIGIWLQPLLPLSPAYSSILSRLQQGGSLLDIGCFLGQDLRRLTFDGAPSDRLYGVDIVSHWDVGYSFFRDRDHFKAHFYESDILVPNSALQELRGKIDIVVINLVLHQWDLETQKAALKQVVGLSAGAGAMLVGCQIGSRDNQATVKHIGKAAPGVYWHDQASFVKLWDEVGRETETRWETEARLVEYEEYQWKLEDVEYLGPDCRVLEFVVTRKA